METQKLEPEFKAKWLAALRSGEYKQGRNLLHSNGSYCCLGVACVISGVQKELIMRDWWIRQYGEIYQSLPELLKGATGVPGDLAKMNDSGKSFLDIADWIEANL